MKRRAFPSRGRTRRGWAGSTAARWARSATARWGSSWPTSGPRGHTLLDRELYLPEAWTKDPARLRAVGLAPDAPFATKPQLAQRMLERVLAAGPPVAWVTGDAVYGRSRELRSWLEKRGLHHVLAVPRNEDGRTVVGFVSVFGWIPEQSA